MLLKIDIDHKEQEIHARMIDVHACNGIVLPHDYNDFEIIEFCNSEMAAPECGDFYDYTVIR